jgi:hypothetical protein
MPFVQIKQPIANSAELYVHECLKGGPPMSAQVQTLMEGSPGTLDVFAPVGHDLSDFRVGRGGAMADSNAAVEESCRRFLHAENTFIVLEHMHLRDTDNLTHLYPTVRFSEHYVYQVVGAEESENLKSVVKEWVSVPYCVLAMFECNESVADDLRKQDKLKYLNFRELDSSFRGVLVGAFDGEGFVSWRRTAKNRR